MLLQVPIVVGGANGIALATCFVTDASVCCHSFCCRFDCLMGADFPLCCWPTSATSTLPSTSETTYAILQILLNVVSTAERSPAVDSSAARVEPKTNLLFTIRPSSQGRASPLAIDDRIAKSIYRIVKSIYRIAKSIYRIAKSIYRIAKSIHRIGKSIYRIEKSIYRITAGVPQ